MKRRDVRITALQARIYTLIVEFRTQGGIRAHQNQTVRAT